MVDYKQEKVVIDEHDYSIGKLSVVQVHAHMQLAAMILFPEQELMHPNFEKYVDIDKPHLTTLTLEKEAKPHIQNVNSDILFDVAQVCMMYSTAKPANIQQIRHDLDKDDCFVHKTYFGTRQYEMSQYKSLKVCKCTIHMSPAGKYERSDTVYMNAQDCLKFLTSDKACSLNYKIFVGGKEQFKVEDGVMTGKKRFVSEARKQQMREYSKQSYYKNKGKKENGSSAAVQISTPQDPMFSTPNSSNSHITNCDTKKDATQEFMKTCSKIMEEVVSTLDNRCLPSSECDHMTTQKRKRQVEAESIRNMACMLFAANSFLFSDSNIDV